LPLETGTEALKGRGPTAQTRGSGSNRPETARVWLLGGFKVAVGSKVIEPYRWRLRKEAALVKLLSLAPAHALHRERVTDILWPVLEAKSAANNLCRALHSQQGGDGQQAPGHRRLPDHLQSQRERVRVRGHR
jgi:hypothetical protein